MKTISKFILFKILRWKIDGEFPKDLNKFVIIVVPHTSWVDFPIGVLINFATGINGNYIGKASLFKPPFGFIFRWLGGTPVDRTKSNNLVNAIVAIFNSNERFILGMSPEGTRKKVSKWKTGFYYVAKGANVPIVSVAFDFEHKTAIIHKPFYTTDDKEADFKILKSNFEGIKGKKPEYS
ncbi:1-acyl-sn-glycerol-3-phosphate acyltransferase [Urechidicola croceus]|uniref:Acyltransferase n=1 Tax=Urechidicola croceus TaxID=1850246 RepID=A0A1D8P5M7_9FLAO|nr:1-acyl-sn-glycerol-3-phosphate acyltransferase [Urechidicola croceus]AOW19857.1 acyltransferase [Urechidicola croceus]